MKRLTIIPARGGSKRIPRKNIKLFHGKPIVAYSIQAALDSGIFEEVMVSTDDDQIAEIARTYGAKVPFMRSKENSDDFSTTAEVLVEVLEFYKQQGRHFDEICCLYPTSPFVTPEKLIQAKDLLAEKKADSVIPITPYSFPIWRSFKLENEKIIYNWEEFSLKRSQDLTKSYHDCGQFYFINADSFIKSKKLVTDNTYGMEIPESEAQDIDDEEDWKLAEIKYELLMHKMKKSY